MADPTPTRRAARACSLAALALAAATLGGCAAEQPAPASTVVATPPAATSTPTPSATPLPGAADLPRDCRAIVSGSVLAQLGDTPLNDPAFADTGTQPDGTLVCVWGAADAATTNLRTVISAVEHNPTMDALNGLVAEDEYLCYQPDEGVRCEKSWQNERYPVTDGRTLYYREGVLIDTTYSNLAPTGFTDAVVEAVFG
ncbi:DUF3558 domain-containing protein [Microbacterium sp. zg.Y1090]|uniref:DUF3558 domain-containing protein n=1 Tax=Microbacterium TaxID=33882 RepID=UPI00214BAA67|nr:MULTISPECIES: DUF3558 domain-containing protein [unclassified Microbacterium]MCR2813752.1 DUF3558 domain-containing protein [Microbacterium sp. zg.Y1084]MCR2819734.1 DUF3558 domain-containing protein [Microbacterium sp. zg.Y1090]MDL5488044.1 DUF3558 domain-containing protein [Microbacterium sp. zg-Y1211]WIM28026.1 DUF3558 domain-containing protein [Microbacterium sp. zg-Y1090]